VSNYLAVATVTAILQRILQSAVQLDIDGVRVTTLQPRNIGNGTPETGINLFLYHVARNPALNNADVTPFRSKGTPIKRQAAVDLYYMVSFYGNDTELIPQRLLGSVVRTFNDYSTVSVEAIQEALADPTYLKFGLYFFRLLICCHWCTKLL
jgi:Pvc16 N-terminal domain